MKKICHITTVHQPFDTRIFHKECKTLAKAGYEVTLIAQQHNDNDQMTDDKMINDQMTTVIDGVKIIFLPEPKNRLFRIFGTTRRAYKIALEQNRYLSFS